MELTRALTTGEHPCTEKEIASLTASNQVATVTTVDDHGYVTGDQVTISGADQPEYNGHFRIAVLGDKVFTYSRKNMSDGSPTGTVVAQRDLIQLCEKPTLACDENGKILISLAPDEQVGVGGYLGEITTTALNSICTPDPIPTLNSYYQVTDDGTACGESFLSGDLAIWSESGWKPYTPKTFPTHGSITYMVWSYAEARALTGYDENDRVFIGDKTGVLATRQYAFITGSQTDDGDGGQYMRPDDFGTTGMVLYQIQ